MTQQIVGFIGYMGAGKDTAAKALLDLGGWSQINFADEVKAMLYDLNPYIGDPDDGEPTSLQAVINMWGWDDAKREIPAVRTMLQRLGTECLRARDPDFWLNAWKKKAHHTEQNIVATDVRFENEADAIRDYGGTLIYISRAGCYCDGHSSENIESQWADAIIQNKGTPEELHENVLDYLGLEKPAKAQWINIYRNAAGDLMCGRNLFPTEDLARDWGHMAGNYLQTIEVTL